MTRSRRAVDGPPLQGVPSDRRMKGGLDEPLTLHDRSVALPDNVRELLDWLIDEELKRWQREEQ